VSMSTRSETEKDVAVEAPPARHRGLPQVHVLPGAEERQKGREWLGAARSARTRILASYVILLALSAVLAIVALRQVLIIRLDDQVRDALEQEMRELDRLLADGRDPQTGNPFTSLQALFDVYLARNVPAHDEAMLAFVEGEFYRSAVARFPLDQLPAESLADWEALSSRSPGAGESSSGTFETELGKGHFRMARIRLGDDTGSFVVTVLPDEELREIGSLLTYGVAGSLAVLLLASASAWLITGRVLSPVRLLTETASSISKADLTRRIEVRGTGEAAEMARTFNAMLDRLEGVFSSQRKFVQDASHELRDPLTICRGHLELLGEDPEDQRRTIALVLDELDRMGRIVDDLQVLAETEQPDFLRAEWMELELVGHELLAKAGALARRRWELDEAGEGLFFADRQRLTEAVMNLAANAVQHTLEDETIAIGTSMGEEEVRIWVRDTGTGIAVGDQERIFERFTRGSGAHLRYRGGGLGLAIVKAIAEAHGGGVELQSRLGEGSTFTIVLPREPTEGLFSVQNPDR
jgi:two-component system, OmpR family, sensor kinase